RRRHTRFSRDWSSDVCSSDLGIHPLERLAPALGGYGAQLRARWLLRFGQVDEPPDLTVGGDGVAEEGAPAEDHLVATRVGIDLEIGRASCRDRVESSVVAGT